MDGQLHSLFGRRGIFAKQRIEKRKRNQTSDETENNWSNDERSIPYTSH